MYLLPIVFLLSACEKDRTDYAYKGDKFLHLNKRVYPIMEDKGSVTMDILLTAPSEKAVTVNIEIKSNDAVKDVDYVYTGSNAIVFQPGETKKSFTIQIIDNLNPGADKDININITGNDGDYINGFPGNDHLNKSADIIILDNDCPLATSLFKGPVTGYEDSPWWTASPYTYNVVSKSLSPDGNKLTLTISGFFGVQFYVSSAWYTQKVADESPVEIVFDLTDRKNPVYSIAGGQKCMTNITDTWFVPNYIEIVEVKNAPLTIDVCKKTFDITYQVSNPVLSWEVGVNHKVHFKFN